MLYFDQFINESKENDKSKLEKLGKILKRRFSNLDQIHILYNVADNFGYDKILNIVDVELSENPKDVIHSYIMYGPDKYFDGLQFYTKDEILDNHKIENSEKRSYTFKSNLDKIKKIASDIKNMNQKQSNEMISIIKNYSK